MFPFSTDVYQMYMNAYLSFGLLASKGDAGLGTERHTVYIYINNIHRDIIVEQTKIDCNYLV